ncbi:hypothetical protein QJS66_09725 [Kocuria rhizophila]|nr:hypothetical protein QJS66_09725 [Kocuria rhizophila]
MSKIAERVLHMGRQSQGQGAFMKLRARSARELARAMVDLGEAAAANTVVGPARACPARSGHGRQRHAGGARVVRRCSRGPAGDVVRLTVALAEEVRRRRPWRRTRRGGPRSRDGRAMNCWKMVAAQGRVRSPAARGEARAGRAGGAAGVLAKMDAMSVGVTSWRLGAGRARQGEPVQAGAGVEIHAVPGERGGQEAERLLTLHTDTQEHFRARWSPDRRRRRRPTPRTAPAPARTS